MRARRIAHGVVWYLGSQGAHPSEELPAGYSERSATVGSTFVARSAGMYEARSDEASRIRGAATSTTGSTAFTPYRKLWRSCPAPRANSRPIPMPTAVIAAALSQHLPQHCTWLRANRDSDAELARPARHDVRLDSVDADDGQQQRDSCERREHPGAGSIEPHVDTGIEMIPPCLDTEDGHAIVDIPDDAGNRCQHRPFGVLVSNPKLQRHGTLVVLSKRHVHVGGWPGIAERVLHSRNDANHPNGLPGFWSLCVEELNQPSECVLSRPQTSRERVIDDRDSLRGAGCQLGIAEIPAAKHGESEDSSVVAADGNEHCAIRVRTRISGAGRSHVATVVHS